MKHALFLLPLALLLLAGCQSEQDKALNSAIAKNDLAALREFAVANAGTMKEKTQTRYYAAYKRLEEDSTLYAAIQNAPSILAKAKAEERYLAALPSGIHVAEVSENLAEHKRKAEEMSALIDNIRSAVKQYKFVEKRAGGAKTGVEFELSSPDDSGRGEISGAYSFYSNKSKSKTVAVRVVCNPTGTYAVDDRGHLVLHLSETRSYQGLLTDPYWNNRSIREARGRYPTPAPRTLTLTPASSFQSFSGVDDRGAEYSYEAVLK